MHLTSVYTIEQLQAALERKYGAETLIKTTEGKNAEGEDVITVTVVRATKEGAKEQQP